MGFPLNPSTLTRALLEVASESQPQTAQQLALQVRSKQLAQWSRRCAVRVAALKLSQLGLLERSIQPCGQFGYLLTKEGRQPLSTTTSKLTSSMAQMLLILSFDPSSLTALHELAITRQNSLSLPQMKRALKALMREGWCHQIAAGYLLLPDGERQQGAARRRLKQPASAVVSLEELLRDFPATDHARFTRLFTQAARLEEFRVTGDVVTVCPDFERWLTHTRIRLINNPEPCTDSVRS